MKTHVAHSLILLSLVLLPALVVLAGGSREPAASDRGRQSSQPQPSGLQPLVIGMMPAVDSVPLIVAEAEGFYADEGLDVRLELFRDQSYREAALAADTIDATVTDLVNAIRAWENGADYRVLTSTQGIFSVVTAPGSPVRTRADWPSAPARLRTGLLEDSIIFYVAQRMLEQIGLDPQRMEIIPTTQIPVRLEMLVADRLDAAVLPEPVTRMAVAEGAHEIVRTDEVFDWTPGVLLATGTALRQKPAELEALLHAYDRAVEAVNTDPDRYRAVIVSTAGFPPPTTNTMRLPGYAPAGPPDPRHVADVASWMVSRGLLRSAPPYEEIVSSLRGRPDVYSLAIPCAGCN